MATLIQDVRAFIAAHNMSPTAFGDQALRDRHFVRQLEKGRRVWPETEQRVRAFMAEKVAALTPDKAA